MKPGTCYGIRSNFPRAALTQKPQRNVRPGRSRKSEIESLSRIRGSGANQIVHLQKAEQATQKRGSANNPVPVSAIEIGLELTTAALLDRTNLHPFRLKVKELRNVLKVAESPDEKVIDLLGQVKDSIGEWHDYEKLISIAEKVLNHGQCKLIRELKEIIRNKYLVPLAQAERLRAQQLGLSRKNNRRTQTRKPSEPVWIAP